MTFSPSCIVLNGSSRAFGNTKTLLNKMIQVLEEPFSSEIPIVDLCTLNITPYDYLGRNTGDDFFPLIQRCLKNFETIVFATPIYWYTVSAYIKIFLDRFTDVITLYKDLNEKLEGKKISLIVNFEGMHQETLRSVEENINSIFIHFCRYLKMQYKGAYFAHINLCISDQEKVRRLFS
ncbi:putative NAD(P)H-dependent FMN-containing oxidoreductase YwqN [Holospora obtusa F1]|uniref:NAD(P)H-dependent FMN-containing oxidoreductase YwqN n=1 Tax=Holospora obtusa F1 TaxID=1399147 RepID=W6TD49_HOLOB|nr:NAD(P)H-dependent oxidoreductase [Holospora obtusa]ETZ06833.1 putative NAD(P)H-dependent FMN-containing oxidoreductase YwqN [Holospora obtusa F1]